MPVHPLNDGCCVKTEREGFIMSPQKKRERGFTLVEVLVVLVILVLLFSIVGPRILGSQNKANLKKTRIDIEMLADSLEHYTVDNNAFPPTEVGMQVLLDRPADENLARTWDGPYLDAEDLPVDPWGNTYRYAYPPEHGKRDFPNIWSPGKDGQDNTEDDIVNWKVTEGDSKNESSSDKSE